MTTQDGYDWPTPHPTAPQWPPAPVAQPRYNCNACSDTGWLVARVGRFGDRRCLNRCDPLRSLVRTKTYGC